MRMNNVGGFWVGQRKVNFKRVGNERKTRDGVQNMSRIDTGGDGFWGKQRKWGW